MICTHCSHDFTIEESNEACGSCGSFGGCNLVMCPKCGYEQPKIPDWAAKLSQLFSKKKKLDVK